MFQMRDQLIKEKESTTLQGYRKTRYFIGKKIVEDSR